MEEKEYLKIETKDSNFGAFEWLNELKKIDHTAMGNESPVPYHVITCTYNKLHQIQKLSLPPPYFYKIPVRKITVKQGTWKGCGFCNDNCHIIKVQEKKEHEDGNDNILQEKEESYEDLPELDDEKVY